MEQSREFRYKSSHTWFLTKWFLTKVQIKPTKWRKDSFFTNSPGTNGHAYAGEINFSPHLPLYQKVNSNRDHRHNCKG